MAMTAGDMKVREHAIETQGVLVEPVQRFYQAKTYGSQLQLAPRQPLHEAVERTNR